MNLTEPLSLDILSSSLLDFRHNLDAFFILFMGSIICLLQVSSPSQSGRKTT